MSNYPDTMTTEDVEGSPYYTAPEIESYYRNAIYRISNLVQRIETHLLEIKDEDFKDEGALNELQRAEGLLCELNAVCRRFE